ncbi:MAG TPA: LysM peptidoglycan-binding domain-containing protein [Pirellulales bacterium]|nr:LysM peptidoglycan-binding domain-containing protein [Pirellulales bacterium]
MASMRKEVTIGFSVIAVLLAILGGLVYHRAKALWQAPDPEVATASADSPTPIDPRPQFVVAQDLPPADTASDGSPADGGDPQYAPVNRHEPPRTSFLPRQFDRSAPDMAETPAEETPSEQGPGDSDPAATPTDAGPAEGETSQAMPDGPRQAAAELSDADVPDHFPDNLPDGGTNLQIPDQAPAEVTQVDRGPADAQADGAPMMARRDDRRQDWAADAAPADGVPMAGSMPPDNGSNPGPPPADFGGAPPAGFGNPPQREYGRMRGEPARVSAENGRYTVAPNDNYWTIAEKVYGNGGYFKALRELNRPRHPRGDKLQVGDVIDAPPVADLAAQYPDLCPRQRSVPTARQTLQPASTRQGAGSRVYVVAEGDSLFDIARHELGKAARWTEIYDMNRDVLGDDFDYLRPGTELVLPRSDRDSDSVTRKDDPRYQR